MNGAVTKFEYVWVVETLSSVYVANPGMNESTNRQKYITSNVLQKKEELEWRM